MATGIDAKLTGFWENLLLVEMESLASSLAATQSVDIHVHRTHIDRGIPVLFHNVAGKYESLIHFVRDL